MQAMRVIGLAAALATSTALAQSTSTTAACSTSLKPSYAAPSVAPGYSAKLVATKLKRPRGVLFDAQGHLLVVQQNVGISGLELRDGAGGCIDVVRTVDVVPSTQLNHGIALSSDGKTLYASSAETAWSWDYDGASLKTSGANRTVVSGMGPGSDHVTRTLLLSSKQSTTLLVSRGSDSNVDSLAEDIKTGHSQIKAFGVANLADQNGNDYNTKGELLGWGLRNSVGLAEHPVTGGIYSVENSVDEIERDAKDIHQDNPGEELNFHGYLANNSYTGQGGNYGYPLCFAAWDVDSIPNKGGLAVGKQFVLGSANDTVNDDFCANERVSPRLTFQPHQAPLDIKFTSDGNEAYVSFHGSWDRSDPSGYKLSVVSFANGSPVAAADSKTAAKDVMTNPDNSKCPGGCFRPTGLAFDSKGRLFMSSDSTGEIWVVTKDATAGAGGAASSKPSDAGRLRACASSALSVMLGVVLLIMR